MARYYVEEPCGHQGTYTDDGTLLDGMKTHPVGVWAGEYNRGGGKHYDVWCPGGVRRELEDVEIVKAWPYEDVACIHMHSLPVGRYAIIPLSGDTDG